VTNNKILFLFLLTFVSSINLLSQAHLIVGEKYDEGDILFSKNIHINSFIKRDGQMKNRSMMTGDTLYDQSELINYPGAGFGGADACGLTGQLFGVSASLSSNHILADDFVIPAGELWVIDSIIVFNYQTLSGITSTINDVRMQIRQGNTPGSGTVVFGDLTTNRLDYTYFSGIYRVPNSNLTDPNRPIMKSRVNTNALSLSSGTYMLEHLVGGNSSYTGPWSPLRTISTTHIPTGNGYQFNGTWNSIFEFASGGANPPHPKGITFLIYGTSFEDKEAKVNGINYNTLQEAIDATTMDGQEVSLLKNIISATINIGLNNNSIVLKADGFSCTINQLNISNGEYLRWIEDTLTITTGINNNTSGVLWNNANIDISNFINTGVYKGTGTLIGNINNQNVISPGN
jgi:hypothetical protein